MTRKADFNAEEWSTVVEAPLLAGMRVMTAGKGGSIRETVAIAKTYAKAREQQGASELLDELVATPPALGANRPSSEQEIGAMSSERLGEAVRILQEKASTDEFEAYKQFVLTVAEAAAEAHREGGFLKFGGKQVSEGEQAALDEISATLQAGSA